MLIAVRRGDAYFCPKCSKRLKRATKNIGRWAGDEYVRPALFCRNTACDVDEVRFPGV